LRHHRDHPDLYPQSVYDRVHPRIEESHPDKVIDWYDDEIEKINQDEYVFNKDMHAKAYNILNEFRHSI
jgi:hypothetical protein